MISVYEERGIAKGIQQGIEQGIVQGRRDALQELLETKFGTLPAAATKQVQRLSIEQVDAILKRIFTVQTLAELGLPDQDAA